MERDGLTCNSNPFLVLPENYYYTLRRYGSLYGGSKVGRCEVFSSDGQNVICYEPTISVLFDGHIPTLGYIYSDMWASDLFVYSLGSFHADFTHVPGYFGVRGVEIVMFKCPARAGDRSRANQLRRC